MKEEGGREESKKLERQRRKEIERGKDSRGCLDRRRHRRLQCITTVLDGIYSPWGGGEQYDIFAISPAVPPVFYPIVKIFAVVGIMAGNDRIG